MPDDIDIEELERWLDGLQPGHTLSWRKEVQRKMRARAHIYARRVVADAALRDCPGWIPDPLVDHDVPVCDICGEVGEKHERELNAFTSFCSKLDAQAALLREAREALETLRPGTDIVGTSCRQCGSLIIHGHTYDCAELVIDDALAKLEATNGR